MKNEMTLDKFIKLLVKFQKAGHGKKPMIVFDRHNLNYQHVKDVTIVKPYQDTDQEFLLIDPGKELL